MSFIELKNVSKQYANTNKKAVTDEMAEKLKNQNHKMTLGIRGEEIKFDLQNLDVFKENRLKAVIDNTEIMGNENNLYFEFGGTTTVARVSKYEICCLIISAENISETRRFGKKRMDTIWWLAIRRRMGFQYPSGRTKMVQYDDTAKRAEDSGWKNFAELCT